MMRSAEEVVSSGPLPRFVLLIGYWALQGLWPRRSILVMAGINVGVLLLGIGHITELIWGSREAWLERKERERPGPHTSLSLPLEGHASFYICSDARLDQALGGKPHVHPSVQEGNEP